MANSKIYLGSTNIGSLFQGADDISIYLGKNKVYPLIPKLNTKYSGGEEYELLCDGNSTLTLGHTHPIGYQPSAMTEAIIGDCVTEIGGSAFNGCRSLTSCTISSGVTSIGNGAFWGCTSLTSIDIPSGVTSIGDNTFRSCSRLTNIIIETTTPPTLGTSAFDGSTCPILVPSASVDTYKSASGWSDYADRIQAIP